jgi:alpha-tubulin suppressor-like RCC1 family protein
VSAGGLHSLALRSDGTVWAWGNNFFGQLGDGTYTSSNTPVQVPGLTGVIQVSADALHSLALRSDGTVWQWGSDGISGAKISPVEVPGLTGVTKISAGGQFSLALRSDGTVWAWGRNQAGQLGDGTTTSSETPVRVTGLSQVTSISAGFDASLATRTRGITAITSVWAWGGNASGQLGDGTLTNHLTPEQVTGISTSFIAGVSAGYQFAVVLGTDGSVWGWGADGSGQLDNAPTTNPVTRPLELTGMNSGITQISAGYNHVLALESNGTALAWGDNSAGELGDGSTASAVGAVQVASLTSASQVSAGGEFSLAIYVPPWTIVASAP